MNVDTKIIEAAERLGAAASSRWALSTYAVQIRSIYVGYALILVVTLLGWLVSKDATVFLLAAVAVGLPALMDLRALKELRDMDRNAMSPDVIAYGRMRAQMWREKGIGSRLLMVAVLTGWAAAAFVAVIAVDRIDGPALSLLGTSAVLFAGYPAARILRLYSLCIFPDGGSAVRRGSMQGAPA